MDDTLQAKNGENALVYELPEDYIVASRPDAEEFLSDINVRYRAQPFEHTIDSVAACEKILEAKEVLGIDGIRALLDYLEEFDARITVDGVPFELPLMTPEEVWSEAYPIAGPPNALIQTLAARRTANG